MKKLITSVENEGLTKLIGEQVTLWKDCQLLNVKEFYVMISAIESFGILK